MDDNGHGTHCAGIIGAKGDNGEGISGVNWNVTLLPVKFLSASGGGSLFNAIKAIDYATRSGVHIISNSWGGFDYSILLREAIERADNANITFIVASGNDAYNLDARPYYPGSYNLKNMISVGSYNSEGQISNFSNYGKRSVALMAPGEDIFSTYFKPSYETLSGTSMAAPFAAGVAGLLLSLEPYLRPTEIKQRLITTSEPNSQFFNKNRAHGTINAFNAINNIVKSREEFDPALWTVINHKIETDHPMGPDSKNQFTIEIPDAHRMALFFETTGNSCIIKITDRKDQQVAMIYVNNDWSPTITGNYINVVVESCLGDFGFVISKVAYKL